VFARTIIGSAPSIVHLRRFCASRHVRQARRSSPVRAYWGVPEGRHPVRCGGRVSEETIP
jgi:hypothetical protein